MKLKSLIISLVFCLLALIPLPASPQNTSDIEKLSWLLGKWQRTNVPPGTTAFEVWSVNSAGVMEGKGYSLRGTDTTFVEKLRIEARDGDLYYVADVKENAQPVYFKFTQMESNAFVSENPKHDFPTMISYELKDGILTAIISDGGNKRMGFVFKKVSE